MVNPIKKLVQTLYGLARQTLPYWWYYRLERRLDFPSIRRDRRRLGYPLNLKNPTTFNEKLTHRLLFNRDPRWETVTDKFAVRAWLHSRRPNDLHLIPLLQATQDPGVMDFDLLPEQFVIKMNHASALIVFVRNKSEVDRGALDRQLDAWLRARYGYRKLIWPAQNMTRLLLVEPLLLDTNGKIPLDFKFFVLHGRIELVQVDHDRFAGHTRTLYDRDWQPLDITYKVPRGPVMSRDRNYERMRDIAEQLGSEFDFVRVDLYSVGDRVYFGELTMTPESGTQAFQPGQWDEYLGSLWKYP